MIGNDIVDLNIASVESDWQRKGFLNKIFTKEEQSLILKTSNSFKMVWLLWSMKESAYKVHIKQYGKRFFAPQKFQCVLTSNTTGVVKIYEHQYYTNSSININYIATTATLNFKDIVLTKNFQLKETTYKFQHKNCYSNLKRIIANKMNFSVNKITIKKDSVGIPRLFFKDNEQQISFTISHHGNYGGYAILN